MILGVCVYPVLGLLNLKFKVVDWVFMAGLESSIHKKHAAER